MHTGKKELISHPHPPYIFFINPPPSFIFKKKIFLSLLAYRVMQWNLWCTSALTILNKSDKRDGLRWGVWQIYKQGEELIDRFTSKMGSWLTYLQARWGVDWQIYKQGEELIDRLTSKVRGWLTDLQARWGVDWQIYKQDEGLIDKFTSKVRGWLTYLQARGNVRIELTILSGGLKRLAFHHRFYWTSGTPSSE